MWEVHDCYMELFRDISSERSMFLSVSTDLTNPIEEMLDFRSDLMRISGPPTPVPTWALLHLQLWSLHELLDRGVRSKELACVMRGCMTRVDIRVLHALERMGEL